MQNILGYIIPREDEGKIGKHSSWGPKPQLSSWSILTISGTSPRSLAWSCMTMTLQSISRCFVSIAMWSLLVFGFFSLMLSCFNSEAEFSGKCCMVRAPSSCFTLQPCMLMPSILTNGMMGKHSWHKEEHLPRPLLKQSAMHTVEFSLLALEDAVEEVGWGTLYPREKICKSHGCFLLACFWSLSRLKYLVSN